MPFIVWDTGKQVPEGIVDNSSVICALDMFNSLCALAKVSLPKAYKSDGTDKSMILLGNRQERNTPLFWEYRRNNSEAFPKPQDSDLSPSVAVRDGEWKILMNADGSDIQLYNLHDNPRENINVSESYPEITRRLTEMALKWRNSLPPLN
jgi:arylsulfatase A-like enzyme